MPLQLFGDFAFAGGSSANASKYQDSQACINFYPEVAASKAAKSATALLGAPGLRALVAPPGIELPTLGTVWAQPSAVTNLPVRGLWVLPGRTQALAVIGNTCYVVTYQQPNLSVLPTLSMNAVGTLITSSGFVGIRDNNAGGYAVIVDGPNYYLYNLATQAFTLGNDPAWLGSNTVAFIDGWWIFNRPGTQTFYTNYPQYGTGFNGSYYALKDAFTDNLMGVWESKEELWLPGEETTEIWYDAGGQYFPFQRLVGTMAQVGCKSYASIARLSLNGQDGLIWFGRSDRGENVIVRTQGFGVVTVSTPGVSDAIAQYTYTADALGYTYQSDGHEFYVLTFPTADATWVYDATMPPDLAWTERASYDPYAAAFHRHRSNAYMNFAGMRIVGDYQNGVLYELTRNVYSDASWPLYARRRSPHIWDAQNRERVAMASLQVDFSRGPGTQTGLGANPQAYLSISRDGGTTYGQVMPSPMGAAGQYQNRTLWRRLGFSRDSVAQIDVIAPVNRDIVGATLRAFGP